MTEQEKLYWGVVRILEDGERLPLRWTFDERLLHVLATKRALEMTYSDHCYERGRFREVPSEDSVKFEEVKADD